MKLKISLIVGTEEELKKNNSVNLISCSEHYLNSVIHENKIIKVIEEEKEINETIKKIKENPFSESNIAPISKESNLKMNIESPSKSSSIEQEEKIEGMKIKIIREGILDKNYKSKHMSRILYNIGEKNTQSIESFLKNKISENQNDSEVDDLPIPSEISHQLVSSMKNNISETGQNKILNKVTTVPKNKIGENQTVEISSNKIKNSGIKIENEYTPVVLNSVTKSKRKNSKIIDKEELLSIKRKRDLGNKEEIEMNTSSNTIIEKNNNLNLLLIKKNLQNNFDLNSLNNTNVQNVGNQNKEKSKISYINFNLIRNYSLLNIFTGHTIRN